MQKKTIISNASKRGQIEIMGLLLIMILVAIGLIFVVKVVFTKKPANQLQTYDAERLTSSFVNVLLQTDTQCTSDTTFQDLLIDCAKMPGAQGTIICANGQRSCPYANETISHILENSIDQWGVMFQPGYEFKAVAPNGQAIVSHISGDLSQSTFGTVTPFPIRLYPQDEELLVYLCVGGCG